MSGILSAMGLQKQGASRCQIAYVNAIDAVVADGIFNPGSCEIKKEPLAKFVYFIIPADVTISPGVGFPLLRNTGPTEAL